MIIIFLEVCHIVNVNIKYFGEILWGLWKRIDSRVTTAIFAPGVLMRIHRFILSIMLFIILAGCADARKVSGKVVSIQDGDTITILAGKAQHKIRLEGIDCPEKSQAWGNRARQYTSELVFGKHVRVEYTGRDRYDRILGTVYLPDGGNLNQELLKAGMAWHYKYYNHSDVLADLEKQAQQARIGLWSDPKPIPPWDFRRKK